MNACTSAVKQLNLVGIYHRVSKQQVRFRNVVNTRKPRPMHFWYQTMEKVTQIKLPKPYDHDFPQHLKCRKSFEHLARQQQEENPYEKFLANETIDLMNDSKMILILHRNRCHGRGYYYFKSFKTFKKQGMTLIKHGRDTIELAVKNTKFANISQLYQSHTMMLCSPHVDLHLTYNLLKDMPFYILLAGIVEDRFLNRRDLDKYSKLKDIQEARNLLSGTLSAAASTLVNSIGMSANTTVSLLHQRQLALTTNSDPSQTLNEEDATK